MFLLLISLTKICKIGEIKLLKRVVSYVLAESYWCDIRSDTSKLRLVQTDTVLIDLTDSLDISIVHRSKSSRKKRDRKNFR